MKLLVGTVISTKMEKTAIVEVVWKTAHPLYKKLLKRSRKYKVSYDGFSLHTGDTVQMKETKKVAKDKYFAVTKVLNEKESVAPKTNLDTPSEEDAQKEDIKKTVSPEKKLKKAKETKTKTATKEKGTK